PKCDMSKSESYRSALPREKTRADTTLVATHDAASEPRSQAVGPSEIAGCPKPAHHQTSAREMSARCRETFRLLKDSPDSRRNRPRRTLRRVDARNRRRKGDDRNW